jgi:hypothetical protein
VQPLVLSPKVWMCMPRLALASWPLRSHEMVVGADSDSCSKVMVPVTVESPRTTQTMAGASRDGLAIEQQTTWRYGSSRALRERRPRCSSTTQSPDAPMGCAQVGPMDIAVDEPPLGRATEVLEVWRGPSGCPDVWVEGDVKKPSQSSSIRHHTSCTRLLRRYRRAGKEDYVWRGNRVEIGVCSLPALTILAVFF